MATAYGLSLSNTYKDWHVVYQLQSDSQFVEALSALAKSPKPDTKSQLYAKLVRLNLELFVAATSGIAPSDADFSAIHQIDHSAKSHEFVDIHLEALFLAFDCFPSKRDGILEDLERDEAHMDVHTRRRWLHRKGLRLMTLGNLQEAHDLWAPLVTLNPTLPVEADDSLATLLLDFGRLYSHLGKFSEAVEIYNHCLCASQSLHNQALSLIRLANGMERISRPAQADKRRQEYFHMIQKPYPAQCAMCSGVLSKEPKFLIPCCKTVVHSECLRTAVSDLPEDETSCPFCATMFYISEVADPAAVTGRRYKKTKKNAKERANSATDGDMEEDMHETEVTHNE